MWHLFLHLFLHCWYVTSAVILGLTLGIGGPLLLFAIFHWLCEWLEWMD